MNGTEPPALTDSTSQEQPSTTWKMPKLSLAEKLTFPVIGLGAVGIGGLGLFMSFENVTKSMRLAGVEHPELVPIAVDIAIPVFSLLYLVLIRFGMELGWPRWMAWALTYATIHLNVTSTNDFTAQLAHAALPALWIGITEIIAHAYRVQIGRANGTRPDPIPFIDWVLAPFATAHLFRYMRLWKIGSHKEGLAKKQQRMRAMTALRNAYGRFWRFKAPLDLRSELRLGELTDVQVYEMRQLGVKPSNEQLLKIALHRAPSTFQAPEIAPAVQQRELENSPEQTALPVGARSVDTAPEQDAPYTAVSAVSPGEEDFAKLQEQGEAGAAQPMAYSTQPLVAKRPRMSTVVTVESGSERDARERQEDQENADRRQANYESAVAVVLEYLRDNKPVTGPIVAADERVPVGARTVQRYLQKMAEEGHVKPEDIGH
ncbi:DUF2637 domain-containing protein [Streptomyces sp. NBC_01304]|uniref:DUF2637 domain-containing protein n=1 Tax=Streptomyces sp. NBC_01304 TaxID=2903818 RepID=UPI002E133A93|nr:DUF2637 domain-containing protein [Streptomyces sp. NBC_01304]